MTEARPHLTILGIDPGSQVVGWGAIAWRGRADVALIGCGTVTVRARDTVGARLLEIHTGVTRIFEQIRPDALSIEEVFYGKSFQSALRIGEARGACLLAATSLAIPTFSYSAAEIKAAVTGNGRAHKTQIQAMVARLLRLDAPPRPADAADALACALCHSHRLSVRAVLPM